MEKVTYFAQMDGISLERMVRTGQFDMRCNHFHSEYEIFYLIRGERRFFFNNRAYLMKSGSLTLVDSGDIHMTRSVNEEEDGHDRIILYITHQKMEMLQALFPGLNLVRFFSEHYGVFDLTPKQQEAFMEFYNVLLYEFQKQKPNYKTVVQTEIINYLIRFMREVHKETPIFDRDTNSKSSKYRTVYNIVDYISEHYEERLTLEGLANQFFLSKFYLSRSFKEVTGFGMNEYINILRIKKASILIAKTSQSISDIALETGFESITYFEKIFKYYMTMSPLKYRKTLNTITYQDTPTPSDQE